MNYLVDGLQNFANFKGRTAKKPFWMFMVFVLVIQFAFGFLGGLMDMPILGTIVGLVLAIPTYAIGARRMHDVGKSGWFFLVPLYNLYLAFQDSEPIANHWGDIPQDQ